MKKLIGSMILKLWGFELDNPYHVQTYPKLLYVVIPHTSSWDVPLGLAIRWYIGADIKYIGKKSLFKPPFGWFLKAIGGYPVDRSGGKSQVDGIVDILNSKENFHLCITPEGTRKKVEKLKSGFYHVARKADIPITLVKFDFGNKKVSISQPYHLGDDLKTELQKIEKHYQGVLGKIPEYSYNA